MEFGLAMVSFLMILATASAGVAWTVGPLVSAAKGRSCPPQFSLVDLLALCFVLQFWTLLVQCFDSPKQIAALWIPRILGWVALVAVWWFGVRTLSRAGIHGTWLRCLFLVLVLPVTVVAPLFDPVLAFVVLVLAFAVAHEGPGPSTFALLAGTATLAAGMLFQLGVLTRSILAHAAGPNVQAVHPSSDGASDAEGRGPSDEGTGS